MSGPCGREEFEPGSGNTFCTGPENYIDEVKIMEKTSRPKINPLSRRPRQQRLVMAVRGAAGAGKSSFMRSMADAGLGRLCVFDTERKTRLLKGVGQDFDGLE